MHDAIAGPSNIFLELQVAILVAIGAAIITMIHRAGEDPEEPPKEPKS